jgi:hypothetical protein
MSKGNYGFAHGVLRGLPSTVRGAAFVMGLFPESTDLVFFTGSFSVSALSRVSYLYPPSLFCSIPGR